MNLYSLTNTKIGVGTAMLLARLLPPALGYRLADWAAGLFVRRPHLPNVKAVRANQRVVRGPGVSEAELDMAVCQVFKGATHCLYEHYHLTNRPEQVLRRLVFSPKAQALIDQAKAGQPVIVVGVHLSAFDLLLRGWTLKGMPILILTLNNFTPGYRLQYLARRGENMEIVPTSIETLRLAKKRLKSGGSILTGLDRPLPQQEGVKYQPRFFGKPSNLPVAYVRLALDTGAPVTVAGCIPQPDGSYRIEVSELVVMQPEKSMYDSIINNTERVLAIAEPMVRQYADHWSMFHPVWRYDE